METLKYSKIKSEGQYLSYCKILEEIVDQDNKEFQDEIELLTLLIEKWDSDHNSFYDSDPVEVLKLLMEEHHLRAKDLVPILELTKGTISKILSYQKGFSKASISKLSAYFMVSQEAFNRPYTLKNLRKPGDSVNQKSWSGANPAPEMQIRKSENQKAFAVELQYKEKNW